jgi:argininosuccinate synthase
MTQRVVLAYPGGLDMSGATFAQPVATGFVELWGLPSEIAALRDAAAAG